MATSTEYFEYIKDQLSGIAGISFRKMMGEYIVYVNEKIAGGIYDDRFLVKPVKSACELLHDAPEELPYEGAKPMLLVEETDSKEFLSRLILAMEPELPVPKKKRK